jgi:hypothetical protein
MKNSVSIERIGLVTGLITAAALIAYFFIMKALNLAQIIELRFFNILIIAVGIYSGIYYLKQKLHEDEFYLKGLGQGMIITVVTVVAFATFMTIYLNYYNLSLMEEISKKVPYTGSLNAMVIFVAIFMEGLASGAIITFASMQYLKSQGTVKTGYE